MLKITLQDSADELCLRLEGKLTGPWVGELRQCWLTASSTTQSRRTVIDLREVDFVDPDGESLLREMTAAGAALQASTPFMRSVVEAIVAGSGYDTVKDKPTRSTNALFCPDPSRRHTRAV